MSFILLAHFETKNFKVSEQIFMVFVKQYILNLIFKRPLTKENLANDPLKLALNPIPTTKYDEKKVFRAS